MPVWTANASRVIYLPNGSLAQPYILADYKLALTFTDKKVKIVDLEKYSNRAPDTVFYPFKDLDFFRSVKVDKHTGTIVWPNGVDLCPDVLYDEGVEIKAEKKKPTPKKSTKKSSSSGISSKHPIAAKPKQ